MQQKDILILKDTQKKKIFGQLPDNLQGQAKFGQMQCSTFMHLGIDFHSEFPNYIRIPAIREREDGKKKK